MNRVKTGPASLHPSGYGVVPVALMRHSGADVHHRAVYAATASAIDFDTGAGEVRLRRIAERSGMAEAAARRKLADLETWGFLRIIRVSGRANRYWLLPTPCVTEHLQTEAAADRASTPEDSGRRGGTSSKGPTQHAQDPSPVNNLPEADLPDQAPASHAQGTPLSSTQETPLAHASDSSEALPELGPELAGATSTHTPLIEINKTRSLRKAVGRQAADDATTEVTDRIQRGEAVERRWALAREIGECYRGRCRNRSHAGLHGAEALTYHKARRADTAQEDRAQRAQGRVPRSEPDAHFELEKRRQLAEMTRQIVVPAEDAMETRSVSSTITYAAPRIMDVSLVAAPGDPTIEAATALILAEFPGSEIMADA